MIQFSALLKKEVREAVRDHRALMVAMMMALLAPVVIFAMSKMMIKEIASTPAIYLEVSGFEYAPKLMKKLKDDNILPLSEAPGDEKAMWQERSIALSIPETFSDDMVQGKTIGVKLKADFTEKSLNAPLRRIKKSVEEHARLISYQRLVVRGIDAQLLRPIDLVEQDTAEPSSNFTMISTMLGLYLLMAAFMSGLSVAIDSSAGERERNVLEVLLCQPVSTLQIILAKLCTASAIAILGVVLTLVLTSLAIGYIDLTKIGATFSLDAFTVFALLVMLLPICFFASALQLYVSFKAKSFKEAQSTVTMIILLPAMIPFAMMFMDDKPKWMDWLPVSGQTLLMEDLFKGMDINWIAVGATGAVTIAITVALVMDLSRKLKSEKVVLALS